MVTRHQRPGRLRFSKTGKRSMGQPGHERHASGLKCCHEGHPMLDHSQGKSYHQINQTTASDIRYMAGFLASHPGSAFHTPFPDGRQCFIDLPFPLTGQQAPQSLRTLVVTSVKWGVCLPSRMLRGLYSDTSTIYCVSEGIRVEAHVR